MAPRVTFSRTSSRDSNVNEFTFICDHCGSQIEIKGPGTYMLPKCLSCKKLHTHLWTGIKITAKKAFFTCSVEGCKAKLPVQDLPNWHAKKNEMLIHA